MTKRISHLALEELSRRVAHRMGLDFPRNRWRELMRGISTAAPEFGFADAESCIESLLSGQLEKKQIEILAAHLTIGETYFFREQRTLDILKDNVLPKLIRSRMMNEPHLRIWSAACSTGEEPYSLAILLNQLIPDIKNWKIDVIATDINPQALKKAAEGVYGEWSFRGTPQWVKEKYFERTNDNRYRIIPRIKQLVTFSYLNLAADIHPFSLNNNLMDIILCRNVLMYFTAELAGKIVRQFSQCLTKGGWLVTSPVDAAHLPTTSFTPVNFNGVTVYQKNEDQTRGLKNAVIPTIPGPENPSYFLNYHAKVNSSPVEPANEFKNTRLPDTRERDTLHTEALLLYEQGQYGEVEDKALKLIALDAKDAQAQALLARVYANQGKLDEALHWAKKAVETDKSSAAFHYLVSIIRQEQDQVEDAIVSLQRTLYLEPDFVQAHFAMGNLMRQQGRSKESERYFQNALALLSNYDQDKVLPESGGINAGRLMEIIRLILNREMPR